jgi:hypothetical protein
MDDLEAKLNENGLMFRVQAPYGSAARCIEQNERAAKYLNSGDAFVVFTPGVKTAFLWGGAGANEQEIVAAKQLMDAFTAKPEARIEIKEGEEQ